MDALRGFAALFVVLLHVTAGSLCADKAVDSEWIAANVLNGLTRWTVPVFVMLSGAFMLKKNFGVKSLWLERIGHLFFILIFWNVVSEFYIQKAFHISSLRNIFFPNFYHLWFLYMLIGLYALLPLLKCVVEQGKEVYLLTLWFLFEICVNTTGVGKSWLGLCNLQFGDYIGYFVLGHYLYERRQWVKNKPLWPLACLGAAAMAFAIWQTYTKTLHSGNLYTEAYDNLHLYVFLTSVTLFVAFMKLEISPDGRFSKVIVLLSRCSLGIYLMHPFLINKVKFLIGREPMDAAGLLAVWTGTCLAVTAMTWLLLKIPVVRKIVK